MMESIEKRNGRELCRPGGFSLTDELVLLSGLTGREQKLYVVDVGCGEGATVERLRRLYPSWMIVGIDPDPSVRAEGMIETGRAEALPFSDGSVDILLMECSFSKTQDPKRALSEVFRVLNPEGVFLLSDMYARKKEMDFDGLLGRLDFGKRIWKLLSQAGFSVLEMQDRSEVLADWVGQQIMDGNGSGLYQALGADYGVLKEAGCGYFICTARPSGLWETLNYAKESSPYYKELFHEMGVTKICPGDWKLFESLPFSTSEELRKNPERFLCVPPKEIARIITLKTSGSTGNPKRLFFTESDLMRTADFFEKGMQYMVAPGERVTVYMEGPGFFSIGGLLKEGLGRIGVEVTVHGLIRDMALAAADGEGRDCFVGTPGQMYGLAVQAPHLRPKTVLLSADYVPGGVQDFLEKTWGCLVFTHWGMTETGYGGGVMCREREGYHLRDEDLLIEVIDPDTGRPAPEGQYGELVLTTLRRKGMPLIRYRTGDWGRFLTEPCGCGCLKPRLDKVEGRLDDVIRLPNGQHLSMHVLDDLLLHSGEIQDFEAVYDTEKRRLHLALMGKEDAVQDALQRVSQYFNGALAVTAERVVISPYIGSGKRKIRMDCLN